jgi:threonine synthase
MRYLSTRGGIEPVAFCQAVQMGLADDGGLLVPEFIPDVRDRLEDWRRLDYRRLAAEVIGLYADDIEPEALRGLIERSYAENFPPGVVPVCPVDGVYVLELYHGPTLAFKDVALQFLGNLFEHLLGRPDGPDRMNILGATSGDTGSAAIAGVRGRKGMHIFMMHPRGRVSELQQRQMTTVLDENVHNLAIEGSFDDCQRILKAILGDVPLKRSQALAAVNSVNWARVVAQIVYYFHAAFRVQDRCGARSVRFSVPTGNFGDILAGWYAQQMGLPIDTLLLATNENDILARFFRTGEYSLGEVVQTLSPSMDIQVASNFERYLFHLLSKDARHLCALMEEFSTTGRIFIGADPDDGVDPMIRPYRADRAQTLKTIRRFFLEHDYLLDPHTAAGVHAATEAGTDGSPVICLATASPAKFPEAICASLGSDQFGHHPRLEALKDLPSRCDELPADAAAVRQYIEKTLAEA